MWRWCRIESSVRHCGDTLGVHSVLGPYANKPINSLRQQHVVHDIGSDAVDGRDESRRGGGNGMGVATNGGGGGDGGGSSTAHRWSLLATLPGTQDTPQTSNPPFDWNKTYINNAARNMRTPCGLGWCFFSVFW